MKPIFRILAVTFFLFLGYSCSVQKQPVYSDLQQRPIDFQVFYDELSPYGQWVNYPNYGYVWLPEVNRNFSPYSTDGYWVNTEYGWTWVSDYRWGWAPFHYGRWDFDDYYGWFWVPDNEWGPSWVNWRSGNGYYGWAPMRPGMNIDRGYNDGYRDINHWIFVRDRDFGRRDINRFYIDRREYNTIINNSTVINNTTVDRRRNTTYVAGPPRENVQRETGRRINSVVIRDTDIPGQNLNSKELQIYRPRVEQNAGRTQQPTPRRVTDIQEVKPVRERNISNPRDNVSPNDNRSQQALPTGPTMERRREAQPANRQNQPVTPQQNQQLEKQQQEQQIQRQQQQVERQQQMERRKQERQQIKQQGQQPRNATVPSGNTRRERQKPEDATERE